MKGKMLLVFKALDRHLLTESTSRFGWVNASFVYGLEILNAHQRRALGAITPYETYNKAVAIQNDSE